jgi:hypothetical protein
MKRLFLMSLAVVWCLLMAERPAHAYMDPGSGSMFLQLVLGGFAGLALIAKLYWRRFLSLIGLRRDTDDPERESNG